MHHDPLNEALGICVMKGTLKDELLESLELV